MSNYSTLEKKCCSCQSKDHELNQCNLITLKLNKFLIIKKFIKNQKNIERKYFKRKKCKINSLNAKKLINKKISSYPEKKKNEMFKVIPKMISLKKS